LSLLVQPLLGFGRQVKETTCLLEYCRDKIRRDAVALDVQKALIETGGPQLRAHFRPFTEIGGTKPRNIDDRKLLGRNSFGG
jgi:hypothetical protein